MVVIDTTKVRLFKQITTHLIFFDNEGNVVIDTTKVRLFKQITTNDIKDSFKKSCY